MLKDTIWLPWYLGGTNGSFEGMNQGMPYLEIPPQSDTCILVFFSLYCYQLLDLLFGGFDRPEFNEMLTHHICAVSLTFCTIFANSRGLGLIIAYLHGMTDIIVNFSRICSSIHNNILSYFSIIILLSSWIWVRLFAYGYICFRLWGRTYPNPEFEQFNFQCKLEATLCTTLLILHVHWCRLLFLMLFNF